MRRSYEEHVALVVADLMRPDAVKVLEKRYTKADAETERVLGEVVGEDGARGFLRLCARKGIVITARRAPRLSGRIPAEVDRRVRIPEGSPRAARNV